MIPKKQLSRIVRWSSVSVFVFLGAVIPCSVKVFAADSPDIAEAKGLFAAAEKDQQSERWADALEKLERVAAIKETAGVRFHIAVCQENLGMLVKSLANYERAREIARDTGTSDVLELVGSKIADVRARVPSVRFEIPADAGSFVVEIDGLEDLRVATGVDVRLDPGEHDIVAKVRGDVRLRYRVSLREGQSVALRLPEAVTLPADNSSDAVGSTSAASPNSTPDKPIPNDTDAQRPSVPTAAWIALGAGVVLGVGGILAYSKAGSLASESADACAQAIECDVKRRDAVRRWDGGAIGLWVGSAVGIGTGVGLILLGRKEAKPATVLVLSPSQLYVRTAF